MGGSESGSDAAENTSSSTNLQSQKLEFDSLVVAMDRTQLIAVQVQEREITVQIRHMNLA